MAGRVSVWVMADQLRLDHPALLRAAEASSAGRSGVRVVMVESLGALRRLPYHRVRQVLHLSAGRHFAEELRAEGYEVEVVRAPDSRSGLKDHVDRHRPDLLVSMDAADWSPRRWQRGGMAADLGVDVEVLPNGMFLSEGLPIPRPDPGRRFVMEDFYRAIRKRFSLLIGPDGEPTSGRWNYDMDNRRRLPGRPAVPPPPRFEPDAITRRAIDEVEAAGFGVGSALGFDLPVTRVDALAAFDDFLARRLPEFGTFEDAMSRLDGTLYHSTLSAQLNLGLLEPLAMARQAEGEYRRGRAPINSVEGFIRQVVGWREFIYWQYHRQMPGLRKANAWGSTRPIPRMFWDGQTDLACIRAVVSRLTDSGYAHHIERLMVVCNFCLLAGVDPSSVADWFLSFYADSHDWVVLPNVIGMGMNADGGRTATKPYVASGAYIKRMGDFCDACPKRPEVKVGPDACPFSTLYWDFLIRHEEELKPNERLGLALVGLTRIDPDERRAIAEAAEKYRRTLEPWSGPPLEADATPRPSPPKAPEPLRQGSLLR